MGSRKCFAYCNDCSDYVTHDNTDLKLWRGKKVDKCATVCRSCKNVVNHDKNKDYNNKCQPENKCQMTQYAPKTKYVEENEYNNDDYEYNDDAECDNKNDDYNYKYTKQQYVKYESRRPICPPRPCSPRPCPPRPCPPRPCSPKPCLPTPCLPRPCPPKPCPKTCSLAETLISVRDPTTDIFANSAQNIDLTGWTDLIIDARDTFDNETGTYTVRCPGDFEVSLVVNYRTAFPLILDVAPQDGSRIGEPDNNPLTRVPRIELYDVATDRALIASQFPVVHILCFIPSPITDDPAIEIDCRAVLEAGQVIINAVLPLVCGQRLRFRVVQNGLDYPVPLPVPISTPVIDLSAPGSTTTASFKKLRDPPIVSVVVC